MVLTIRILKVFIPILYVVLPLYFLGVDTLWLTFIAIVFSVVILDIITKRFVLSVAEKMQIKRLIFLALIPVTVMLGSMFV